MGAFKHISSEQSLHAETTDFSSSSEQMSRYTVIEAPGPVNDCLPPTATNLPDNPTPVDDMPLSEGELMASVLGDDDPRLHEKRDHWRSLAEECRHADNADGQTPDRKIALSRHKLAPPIVLPKSAEPPKPEPPITIEPVEPFDPDTIQPDSPEDWVIEPFEAPEVPNSPWDDEPPEMTNRPVYGSSPATLANNTDSQNAGNSIPLNDAGVIAGKTSSHSQLITESSPMFRGGAVGSHPHASKQGTRSTMSEIKARLDLGSINYEHIDFTEILKRTIAYKDVYSHIGGDLNCGVYIAQLIYLDGYYREEFPCRKGWFFKYQSELALELGMTERSVMNAEKQLEALGILQKCKQSPKPFARRITWKRLNKRVLNGLIFAYLNTQQYSERDDKIEKIRDRCKEAVKDMVNAPWINPENPDHATDFHKPNIKIKPSADQSENGGNTSTAPENPRTAKSVVVEDCKIGSSRDIPNLQLSHTEITNRDNKQKTTTTSEARAKISEPDFVNRVSEAMKTSGILDYFVLEMASEIWEQYSTPRVAMAIKIIYNDWTASEGKSTRLNTQQEERQPALDHKSG